MNFRGAPPLDENGDVEATSQWCSRLAHGVGAAVGQGEKDGTALDALIPWTPVNRVEANLVRELREAGGDSERMGRHFAQACRKGYLAAVAVALELGVEVNCEQQWGLPLELAADADHVDVVRALLAAGADPSAGNVMARAGVQSLPVLVAAGGRVDGKLGRWNPLLSAIAGRRKQDRALALIGLGADVNVRDADGVTPLMLAAKHGRYQTFTGLLQRGADATAVDRAGRSVLRYAIEAMAGGSATPESEVPSVRRIFCELRKRLPAQPEDLVLAAIASDDAEELRRLLGGGLDPDTRIAGSIGVLGLDIRALLQSARNMADIFSIPLDAQRRDEQIGGCTLLMWAIALGQEQCVRVLLDAGADVNARMGTGASAADISLRSSDRIREMVGTSGIDPFGHRQGMRQFAPTKPTPKPDDRISRLGVSVERLIQFHSSFREYHGDAGDSSHPDYHADGLWGRASVLYVEEKLDEMRIALREVVRLALLYFRSLSATTEADWVSVFSQGAAACAVMNEWKSFDELCQFPKDAWCRSGRVSWYYVEYNDWPFWMLVARNRSGRVGTSRLRQTIVAGRAKGAKLLLEAYEAIASKNGKAAASAIQKYVTFHRARVVSKKHGVLPDRAVSAEATALSGLARAAGLRLQLSPRETDFLICI